MRKSTKKVVAGIVLSAMLMTMGVMTSANDEAVTGEVVTGGAVTGDEDKNTVKPLRALVDKIEFPMGRSGKGIALGGSVDVKFYDQYFLDMPEDSETQYTYETYVTGGVKPYKFELEGAPDWFGIDDYTGSLVGHRPKDQDTPDVNFKIKVTDAVGSCVKIDVKVGRSYKGLTIKVKARIPEDYSSDIEYDGVGTPFEVLIEDFIPENLGGLQPLKFQMEDAPDWIKLDESTGKFYGVTPDTPQNGGEFYVFITDASGEKIFREVSYGAVLEKKEEINASQQPVATATNVIATATPTENPNISPETGDDITVWLVLALCSVGGLTIVSCKKITD